MSGRLLLVCRLLVRDLRRRRTETVLLLTAIAAATATLTLGLTLDEIANRPYQQTPAASAGPDVIVTPLTTSAAAWSGSTGATSPHWRAGSRVRTRSTSSSRTPAASAESRRGARSWTHSGPHRPDG
ncbi:hypothetical protein ACTMTJ_21195 [Phytohabitans sp. LJ34]|uniref:hypothetical protein n=1 Tax=Phytohabitans sp. LJ34 TaxID=3452217 RepID=UPI003F8C37B2